MTHKYEQHIDVRDKGGFYLGALTYMVRDRVLHIRSLDAIPMLDPAGNFPSVVVRNTRIHLTLYTICKRVEGSILRSERTCIKIGGPVDLHVLLDGGYMVLYNRDPFLDDELTWLNDLFQAQCQKETK